MKLPFFMPEVIYPKDFLEYPLPKTLSGSYRLFYY